MGKKDPIEKLKKALQDEIFHKEILLGEKEVLVIFLYV